ncbi:MAG: polyphosphate kinase 1 [Paenibacillaceae bacterium]|nr:polyphosphate kinase 1 [Paenibacillaceae bacterium]
MSDAYINRDVSWLHFNDRVLEEAADETTPLLERGKFLAIFSSNYDEFMGIRVAALVDHIRAGCDGTDLAGYTPRALVQTIVARMRAGVEAQMGVYRQFVHDLANEGHVIVPQYDALSAGQQRSMKAVFAHMIAPILTPMAVDASRPFPLVHNVRLYVTVVLRHEHNADDKLYFALVHVPHILPRLLRVPKRKHASVTEYVPIEVVIKKHIHTLFASYTVVAAHVFRLTRNADVSFDEERTDDLIRTMEQQLHLRKWGAPLRLEVERTIHPHALAVLQQECPVDDRVFMIDGMIDLTFLRAFVDGLTQCGHLRYPKLVFFPMLETVHNFFAVLRSRDVLVHHPFESFDIVRSFLQQAAQDPDVLAIKMTLYRVSEQSSIVEALVHAAELGKQVTVVVELKARFDEERNIAWARRLEKAGCHVVYGLIGLKTHAKLLLIVRKEHEGVRRYVHIGTGNYNDATANAYTDIGLFTARLAYGEDASMLFHEMTGYATPRNWQAFVVAPDHLRDAIIDVIRAEMQHAQEGKRARIIAKVNGLSHKDIIDALYAASQAGVDIDLIVRGVCCLRPGVRGLSERIRVVSIVDRFLEHSRVIYAHNDGNPKVWISSADWLTRNVTRRIEVMVPIEEESAAQSLIHVLELYVKDNVKARVLLPSGAYVRCTPDQGEVVHAQRALMDVPRWKVQHKNAHFYADARKELR